MADDGESFGPDLDVDCSDVGSVPVLVRVTDEEGNTSMCAATVTVQDNTAPDCETKDISVSLNGNGIATISAAMVDDGSSDACGIQSMSVSPNSFDCSNIGDNTVT
ncbi:MAG: hypothetical protein AAF547_16090, partial [Actinomycetota bacterium]